MTKIYLCKLCLKRNILVSGTRSEIREHIRRQHLIKSSKKMSKTNLTDKHRSTITPYMGAIELK